MEQNNATSYQSEYSEIKRMKETFFDKKNDVLPIIPYFRYEIQTKHHQYHLCFSKEPFRQRYENDIFNLLRNFTSVSLAIECLKYHCKEYSCKEAFLEFFRYELPVRIKMSSSKSTIILFEGCLDWIKDQMIDYQMEPNFIGAKAEIEVLAQKEKLMALLKFLVKECKKPNDSAYALNGGNMSVALLLYHFSSYKNASLGTLQKEVGGMKTEDYLSDNLKDELRKFFH